MRYTFENSMNIGEMGINMQEYIKSQLKLNLESTDPNEQLIHSIVTNYKESEHYKSAIVGEMYTRNITDIGKKKRVTYNEHGVPQEEKTLSNAKISIPFVRKLIRQKVSFLLGKPFSIKGTDETSTKYLESVFTEEIREKIYKATKRALAQRRCFMQVYIEDGELKFKVVDTKEFTPVWKDDEETELEVMIRKYEVENIDKDGKSSIVTKVEYYNQNGVIFYEFDGENVGLDMGRMIQRIREDGEVVPYPNFTIQKENENGELEELEVLWQKLPFVWVNANDDCLSVIDNIKSQIDEYNLRVSTTSDKITDAMDSIKVVKGYNGEPTSTLAHNLATYRLIKVEGGGDVTDINSPIDIQATDIHLNRLRKDIFDSADGVDFQDDSLSNLSGIALRLRFLNLEQDADDISKEVTKLIRRMTWFMGNFDANRGVNTGDITNISVEYNKDLIIDEKDIIDNINNSADMLSMETLLEMHPYVKNVQEELEKKRAEDLAERRELENTMFGNMDSVNTNDEDIEE